MRWVPLCILVALLVVEPCSARMFQRMSQMTLQGQSKYQGLWFQQQLDHFDPFSSATFKQRWYFNSDYWNGTGPVILYINGEGPVYGPPSASDDFTVQLAQQFGALITTLEHRYYGLSLPFAELTTGNMKWLTTQQALADLANFLTNFPFSQVTNQPINPSQIKWINIGGSYSGALSAWFRLKYPHLTKGGLASSGVVNAILDFTAFDQQVAQSAGQQCTAALQATTKAIEKMVFGGSALNQQVKAVFQAELLVDDGDFLYLIADSMAESVQYGYQQRLCDTILDAYWGGKDLVQTYADYCINFTYPNLGLPAWYATSYQQITNCTENMNARQWWYQTCIELAYFQNAPATNSIRSHYINMTYHKNHCNKVFGEPLWPDTESTNNRYGGNQIQGTRIFFANGSQDPWQRAGVTYPLSEEEPATVIRCSNCGHCVDLGGCPGGCDGDQLTVVRDEIALYLQQWLSN